MIGELTLRATLQKKTQTADGAGGNTDVWQSFAEIWISLSWYGTADADTDTAGTKARYIARLRRRGDVSAGQRLTVGERPLDILAVQNTGSGEVMKLLCEERQ